MWQKILGVILAGLMLLLPNTGLGRRDDIPAAYTKLSASQAKAVMDRGDPYLLLDVRTEAEFRERHIQGAVLLPHTELKERATSELPDKNALILLYCRSGRRSAAAAHELVRMGYTQVYDFGGINDWPYETATGTGDRNP